MTKKYYPILLTLGLLLLAPAAYASHPVTVKEAWIADAPPIAKIRAAYLTLHNQGDHSITIKSFSSPDFKRIELHKTIVAGGMVKMEEVNKLSVKPGEHIEFKPGGYHLMLFNPKRNLKMGDKVTIKLQLKNNMTMTFTAVVRKRGNGKGMMMDPKHHHKCY